VKKTVRKDGRRPDQLRPWSIKSDVLDHAEGSALVEVGKTMVLCAASVEETVPNFLRNQGKGWVTAEYSMLPRSTHVRSSRERGGRIGGRTLEIQRLIGRCLRCVTDLTRVGERTVTVDCDVIQADGGTRVAAIVGGWTAMFMAFEKLLMMGKIEGNPVTDLVSAVSVGMIEKEMLLDLDYDEDSTADVDMNVAMTGSGRLVEVQATAERSTFSLSNLNSFIHLAHKGIQYINGLQKKAVQNPDSPHGANWLDAK
jgi:ribonuclease PH